MLVKSLLMELTVLQNINYLYINLKKERGMLVTLFMAWNIPTACIMHKSHLRMKNHCYFIIAKEQNPFASNGEWL